MSMIGPLIPFAGRFARAGELLLRIAGGRSLAANALLRAESEPRHHKGVRALRRNRVVLGKPLGM